MFQQPLESFSIHKGRRPAPPCQASCVRVFCPQVEALEERVVPATWIGPAGGAFNVGANWDTGVVPGPGDAAIFGSPGANTDCVLTGAAITVDRVDMTASYTANLTIGAGGSLTGSALFQQNGALTLAGGAAISSNDFYVGGSVTATTAGSFLTAGAGLFLNAGGVVTVTGGVGATPTLTMTSGDVDDASPIVVGTAVGGAGWLSVVGGMTVQATTGITVNGEGGVNSVLGFTAAPAGSNFDVHGTLTLTAGNVVLTGAPVKVDGGQMYSLAPGGTDNVTGDVTEVNAGTLTVGTGLVATMLNLVGSLNAAGTVNLDTLSVLSFGSAPAGSTCTVGGTLNMYGATILNGGETGGTPLTVDIEGGTLTTNAADAISGAVLNNGTIEFAGALHDLGVGNGFSAAVAYVQGSTGVLDMRMEDPASDPRGFGCDRLLVGTAVTLDGTLTVTAIGALPPTTDWFIIIPGPGWPTSGDFAVKNVPPAVITAGWLVWYHLGT